MHLKKEREREKKRPTPSRFALSRRTTLLNLVFQLSITNAQKYEDEMLRLSLEPARLMFCLCTFMETLLYPVL